ncbi:mobilization protein, partial [Escherichia coli]|nr:mobilization protein [Escherichia coli]
MHYPWSGNASWKYRNAHWTVLRCSCDGETMKNGTFGGFWRAD